MFVEDGAQFRVHDAEAGIPYLDAQHVAAAAAADENLAAAGGVQRVRAEVADHLFQPGPIRADHHAAGDGPQRNLPRDRMVGEFVVHTLQQLADRGDSPEGRNGAGLDLVDVEKRVEDARHRDDRVIDTGDQFLLLRAVHGLRQQALEQGQRLQRLPQIVAGRCQQARLGRTGGLRLSPGGCERIGIAPAPGDVGEGNRHAIGVALGRQVGQNAPGVPVAVRRGNLALPRQGIRQDGRGIGKQVGVVGERPQVCERPSDVAGVHLEHPAHCRREEADVEVPVQKDRRQVGTVEQAL